MSVAEVLASPTPITAMKLGFSDEAAPDTDGRWDLSNGAEAATPEALLPQVRSHMWGPVVDKNVIVSLYP